MRHLVAFACLVLCTGTTSAVLAQGVDDSARSGQGTEDAASLGEVLQSFETLPLVLKPGQTVRVRDESGRMTRGTVVSISNDQLVVDDVRVRRGFFRQRREERIYARDSVARIDLVDSVWNGAAIGAAIGIGALAWSIQHARATNSDGLEVWFIGGPVFTLATTIGVLIDARINRPVYERLSQAPRVRLRPLLLRDAKGISAQVRF